MSTFIEHLHIFKKLDTLSSHCWMPLLTTDFIKLHVVHHPEVGICQVETNKDDAQQNDVASTLSMHVFARVRCRLNDHVDWTISHGSS